MIWLARALRIALVGACLTVLSGIIPISLTQFHTGDACPSLGFIPACYIVSVAYSAMAVAGVIWWRGAMKLFLFGSIPVITLAVIGTVSELAGIPTCPRSDSGLPLCYASLAVGLGVLLVFLVIRAIETNRFKAIK
jgi:hypothetical protein